MSNNVKPEDISLEEQAKAFIEWKRRGEEVEWWNFVILKWVQCNPDHQLTPGITLRLKPKPPEPKWRAWEAKEVPIGAVIRMAIDRDNAILYVITAVFPSNAVYSGDVLFTRHGLFENYEWQWQGDIVWQTCGVLE